MPDVLHVQCLEVSQDELFRKHINIMGQNDGRLRFLMGQFECAAAIRHQSGGGVNCWARCGGHSGVFQIVYVLQQVDTRVVVVVKQKPKYKQSRIYKL